jgi:hypothetical protein
MRELLERDNRIELHVGGDERLARAELRRQIGRLERQLAALVTEAFPRLEIDASVPAAAAEPRALGLGGLETVRDGLAARIATARRALMARQELETRNRELLERMLARPEDFKWLRISRADVGEPGCGHWHSRPVLGPIGMLMGWWRVKVSSGCPLAGRLAAVDREAQGGRAPARPVGVVSPGRAGHLRRHRAARRRRLLEGADGACSRRRPRRPRRARGRRA